MPSRSQLHAKRRSTVSPSVKCTAKRSRSEPAIDSLPEGIMHDIVSRLALKDAVRTSLVATNWRLLWTCHPDLCFNSPTILNREPGSRRRSTRHSFIRRVNAILESLNGTRLRRFKIAFTLDRRHAKYLDPWLYFALDAKASIISVNLLPVLHKGSARSWEETYTLPFRILGDSRNRNGILRLASLLEVAPLLQRLELNMLPLVSMGLFNVPETYWHVQPCIHRHLEQVEVSGFIGENGQVELVLYILDNAVALRGMSIEPRMTAHHRVFGYRAGLDFDIRRGRECALKNFLPEDYPDVQIEIF